MPSRATWAVFWHAIWGTRLRPHRLPDKTVDLQVRQALKSWGPLCREARRLGGRRVSHGELPPTNKRERKRSASKNHVLASHVSNGPVWSGMAGSKLLFNMRGATWKDGDTAWASGKPRFLTGLIKSRGVRGSLLSQPCRIVLVEQLKNCITQLDRLGRFAWLLSPNKKEVELRRFEISLLGSDFQRRMQSHTWLEQRGQCA